MSVSCAQGKYTSEVAALQQAVRSRDDRINHLEMDVVGLQARADAASTSASSLSEQVSQLTAAYDRTKVWLLRWMGLRTGGDAPL